LPLANTVQQQNRHVTMRAAAASGPQLSWSTRHVVNSDGQGAGFSSPQYDAEHKVVQERSPQDEGTARPGGRSERDVPKHLPRVAPPINAASSSSSGVVSEITIMIQITIGTVTTRWMMICGTSVPEPIEPLDSRNSGIR